MRKTCIAGAAMLILLLALVVAGPVSAQQSDLTLGLTRDVGYSSGRQIQGRFTLWATGPADLASVVFQIDGKDIGTVTQSPFKIAIDTGQYAPGLHTFTASGRTTDGQTLTANHLQVEMVSGEQAVQGTGRILVPLLGAIVVIVVLVAGMQFLLSGRQGARLEPGTPRHYGAAGGAICPKCGRPYARHIFSPNLITGKLERCPYCGKWAVVPAASREQLRAAEEAELADSKPAVVQTSAEDKLKRQIEDSRYQ